MTFSAFLSSFSLLFLTFFYAFVRHFAFEDEGSRLYHGLDWLELPAPQSLFFFCICYAILRGKLGQPLLSGIGWDDKGLLVIIGMAMTAIERHEGGEGEPINKYHDIHLVNMQHV
ncbi:hypothetical protein BJY01DRAFT_64060 [Aspergillus pseudoustus]|uniref:Copper transporter n=1 Tax=Aspergillus pseudoustus TaxID=1810923 RepID=A0ABR4KMD7_9EURO